VSNTFFELMSVFSNGNDNGSDLYFNPAMSSSNGGATTIEFSGTGDTEMVVPMTCTMSELYFAGLMTSTGSSGETSSITVYHGASGVTPTASTLTCTTNAITNVAGQIETCSDTTHSVSLSAGDTLSLRLHETNDAVTSPIMQYTMHVRCN
jgi:hypothetical protein